MKIKGNTIIFKSVPDLFADEFAGIKPNTVRLLSKKEAEEVTNKWGCIDYIQIVKSTDGLNFKRELSSTLDITDVFNLDLPDERRIYVFSWYPQRLPLTEVL